MSILMAREGTTQDYLENLFIRGKIRRCKKQSFRDLILGEYIIRI